MKWFIILVITASYQQGDLWIPNPDQYRASIAVPDREICEKIASMNYGAECHGVIRKIDR